LFKVDALMGALRLAIQKIEKLNFGRKDSRVTARHEINNFARDSVDRVRQVDSPAGSKDLRWRSASGSIPERSRVQSEVK
jgi:hypothetical protein